MNITWQREFARAWLDRIEHNRMPHAVMLAGPAGVGKRAAAAWIASLRLNIGTQFDMPQYPVEPPAHADLRWISPLEDKKTIGIDQIRELVAEMGLTSYKGGGKVAIIEPANTMTDNAANSLLKTLEEPPGETLLILVADRAGRLPATIFSRCQRIDFAVPAVPEGLAWLDKFQPGSTWPQALALAGNAPLAAISALDQLDTHAAMVRDFAAVGRGSTSALEVAAKWAKLDPPFVLDWLARQVQQGVLVGSTGQTTGVSGVIDESVLKSIDRRNLFCYLDIINGLRGQSAGSFNVHLTLETLLIDWAEGLKNTGQDPLRNPMR
jgi:DNA polymerase-3 subunit delta'